MPSGRRKFLVRHPVVVDIGCSCRRPKLPSFFSFSQKPKPPRSPSLLSPSTTISHWETSLAAAAAATTSTTTATATSSSPSRYGDYTSPQYPAFCPPESPQRAAARGQRKPYQKKKKHKCPASGLDAANDRGDGDLRVGGPPRPPPPLPRPQRPTPPPPHSPCLRRDLERPFLTTLALAAAAAAAAAALLCHRLQPAVTAHPRTRPQRPTKRTRVAILPRAGATWITQRATPLSMTGSRIPRRKPPKRRNLEEAEACLVSMVGFGEAAVTCAKPLVDDVMVCGEPSLCTFCLLNPTFTARSGCLSSSTSQSHGSSSDSPSSALPVHAIVPWAASASEIKSSKKNRQTSLKYTARLSIFELRLSCNSEKNKREVLAVGVKPNFDRD
ncbi:hypothetical protein GW17_00039179 [Ensete ventricosum]|nr:hypothetical protein GW17_00039179 [Ensete ventricosum]